MKFNTEALKAWVGGLLLGAADASSQGNGLGGLIVKGLETVLDTDFPPSFDLVISSGVGLIIGYIAVYFTSNAPPKEAQ